MNSLRRSTLLAVLVCVTAALALMAVLSILQSNWFKNRITQQIISQIEQAGGGQVELGRFDYDWRTLTADFQQVVVHGKEPAAAPPLFHADRVRVALKVISVFKRNIDVSSVEVQHPRLNLVVAPDGTTNLPVPKSGPVTFSAGVQALLTLKVQHFDFKNGFLQVNLRRIPLSLHGGNTFMLLSYDSRRRRYDVTFSSRELHIESKVLPPFSGNAEATAWLERDRLSFRGATFTMADSKINASGTLTHFARPVADIRLSADVDTSDLAPLTKINYIGRGRLMLNGTGHYDGTDLLTFQGKMAARDFSYHVSSFNFKKVNFESDVVTRDRNIQLTHLVVSMLGSRFTGQAALKQGRELSLDGNLSGFETGQLSFLVVKRNVPWSGIASGPLHVRAFIGQRLSNLTVGADLSIMPGSGLIPVSGIFAASYRANGNALEFSRCSINTLNTRLLFSGTLGSNVEFAIDSTNLDDLNPVVRFLGRDPKSFEIPRLGRNGTAHFDGNILGSLAEPQLTGDLALAKFHLDGRTWNQWRSHLSVNEAGIAFPSFVLEEENGLQASASGHIALDRWNINNHSALQVRAEFKGLDLIRLANSSFNLKLPSFGGIASGSLDLHGTFLNPLGSVKMLIANVNAYGERLNRLDISANVTAAGFQITRGHMQAGPAELLFSGDYLHTRDSWREGQLRCKIDSNGFPLSSLAPVREYLPGLNARVEIHWQGSARVTQDSLEPLNAEGTILLRNVTVNQTPYGSISLDAKTEAQTMSATFLGDLLGSRVTGSARIQLANGNPVVGQVHLDGTQLSTILGIIHPGPAKLPFEGLLQGGLTFEGLLREPAKMHGTVAIERLQISPSLSAPVQVAGAPVKLTLRNANSILLEYADGIATVDQFEMTGVGSDLKMSGSVPFLQARPMQLKVNGSVDLHLAELFEPNVRVSGESLLAASVVGPLTDPAVNGTLQVRNASLFSENLPNGLTALNGTVRFDQDRATIEKLTARTGGGELSMGGFVSFGHGNPLVYRLEANAENVRVRYAGSVSVTATSQLRLTGTSRNSILSGTATISRVIFNPNTDLGNLLASSAAPSATPGNEKDFLTGLQFDVHVESAPNLQLSTELSRDVEAEIDLGLRGTPERPILFGNITANQGEVRVFGTKYTINRGEISFDNAVKIEPVVDLDLQTQARGVTVDITISGTPGKLNINYRSDPPLQPRDIVALLTVGRTPDTASNVPNVSVTNDTSALQSGANTVLGQAISPASNRLSKLFGITNIKIDPMVQGITNTPQARLTVEQQVSRQITVTYVTNLSQTSEQIFRLEWDFSTHYSLVALRDDNGEFGIDIQYRKRFK